MRNLLIGLFIVLMIILAWVASTRERYTGPAGPIIEAIERNERNRGSFIDFRKMIGDPNFSPHMYTKLVALERDHKMTPDAVDKILAEK